MITDARPASKHKVHVCERAPVRTDKVDRRADKKVLGRHLIQHYAPESVVNTRAHDKDR